MTHVQAWAIMEDKMAVLMPHQQDGAASAGTAV
jgi:hypothetical protein